MAFSPPRYNKRFFNHAFNDCNLSLVSCFRSKVSEYEFHKSHNPTPKAFA